MAIPEAQLDTWSGQGKAVAQSRDTYAAIKRALESQNTQFYGKDFQIFLQGSYGNDTNIFSESDVDIVIRLDATYHYDESKLSPQQLAIFQSTFASATYSYEDFKASVIAALRSSFSTSVDLGNKAVRIKANGNRRDADVIPATQFRRYYDSPQGPKFVDGIRLTTRDGRAVINYPKQHSDNCTIKHQTTRSRFKPVVRIFKNMRRRLVDDGIIDRSLAPSYFIEGLLYNVPNNCFTGSNGDAVVAVINWILETTDRTNFVCANDQYYLLRDAPDLWRPADCDRFLGAVVDFWNDW